MNNEKHLVVARMDGGDVPFRLFDSIEQATAYIEAAPTEPPTHLAGWAGSTIHSLWIVSFWDGVPVDDEDLRVLRRHAVLRAAAHPCCPECQGTGFRFGLACTLCLPAEVSA